MNPNRLPLGVGCIAWLAVTLVFRILLPILAYLAPRVRSEIEKLPLQPGNTARLQIRWVMMSLTSVDQRPSNVVFGHCAGQTAWPHVAEALGLSVSPVEHESTSPLSTQPETSLVDGVSFSANRY
jgi:hypothetical protein